MRQIPSIEDLDERNLRALRDAILLACPPAEGWNLAGTFVMAVFHGADDPDETWIVNLMHADNATDAAGRPDEDRIKAMYDEIADEIWDYGAHLHDHLHHSPPFTEDDDD